METDRKEALELSKGLSPTASNIERVSNTTTPEAARWAFTQWELRGRAAKKGLPKADQMLFTREALEQASHFAVARYHASLFPKGELVADLTCGIGSDLLALAERGPVIGFDTDAERLEYARHNLAVHGLEGELVLGNCLTKSPYEDDGAEHGPRDWNFDYAFADPSRRVKGKRTLDLDRFSPRPSLLSLRMRNLKLGLIKLSPLIPDEKLFELGHHIEFVSYDRECREALVSCDFKSDPAICAIRAETGSRWKGQRYQAAIHEPKAFVYQVDPAVVRAHATDQSDHRFFALVDAATYITSDEPLESFEWIIVGFRVLNSGKGADLKVLRSKMLALGYGRAIVKGEPGFDVSELTNKLHGPGDREATIILYPRRTGGLGYVFVEPL